MAREFKETSKFNINKSKYNENYDHIDWGYKGKSMNFSEALEDVKKGYAITRRGWNGANQFVVFQKGYPDGIAINKNTSEALGIAEGTIVKFQPYLMMKNAQDMCVPWLASQGDLLAEDWLNIPTGKAD